MSEIHKIKKGYRNNNPFFVPLTIQSLNQIRLDLEGLKALSGCLIITYNNKAFDS